jgi:hypothetical protein
MEVYVLCFSDSVVGVYSSKKKCFKSFLSKNMEYKEEILSDCSSWDDEFSKETKEEVIKFFNGEDYDIDKISIRDLRDLTELVNPDYRISIKTLDK